MSDSQLVEGLRTTLNQALSLESRGDSDAAVAKTAAIKNIQKALTARILKRLDDGQPLVEVARKMKAIEGMQPQINDMERRLGIMQSVEPVLENAIKTLQKVVDIRGMGRSFVQLESESEHMNWEDDIRYHSHTIAKARNQTELDGKKAMAAQSKFEDGVWKLWRQNADWKAPPLVLKPKQPWE